MIDRGEGCPTHAARLPRVQGVEIERGRHVRSVPSRPLGPLWLAIEGPTAMIADYIGARCSAGCSWSHSTSIVAYVLTERSTCAVRTARIMHDVPTAAPLVSPDTNLVPIQRAPGGPKRPRQSARTVWHAPHGVVGKSFGGIITSSAHTVLTLSVRSNQQLQPW